MSSNYYKTVYDWQRWFEAFSVCRRCGRSTVFYMSQNGFGTMEDLAVEDLKPSVNDYLDVEGFVNLADMSSVEPPEHLPEDIEAGV